MPSLALSLGARAKHQELSVLKDGCTPVASTWTQACPQHRVPELFRGLVTIKSKVLRLWFVWEVIPTPPAEENPVGFKEFVLNPRKAVLGYCLALEQLQGTGRVQKRS